jgi:hypothetical protein
MRTRREMFQARYNSEADAYAVMRQARDAVKAVQNTLLAARQGLVDSVADELRQLAKLGAEAAQLVEPRGYNGQEEGHV